jgi:nicotinamidase-related amidase
MPRVLLKPENSVLVVVDVQPSFMKAIYEADRVLERTSFLAKVSRLLEIPVIATEQYPKRMGATDPSLTPHLTSVHGKMSFSCAGCGDFSDALAATGRRQVVLVGVETHICVSLTANALLDTGYELVVCPDGVSSRTMERHKLGMERIRDAGAVPAHTEAVAYEWLQTAEHPKFREALALVKELG